MNACLNPWLSYPSCTSHHSCTALFCHLWPVCFFHMFPYFLTNSIIFDKKKIKQNYILMFSTNFVWNISYTAVRIIQWRTTINVDRSSCKIPLVLSDFNNTNFLDRFSKNPKVTSFTKICAVDSELFQVDRLDGRTDIHEKAKSRFKKCCQRAQKLRDQQQLNGSLSIRYVFYSYVATFLSTDSV